jgi:hypothetical protein
LLCAPPPAAAALQKSIDKNNEQAKSRLQCKCAMGGGWRSGDWCGENEWLNELLVVVVRCTRCIYRSVLGVAAGGGVAYRWAVKILAGIHVNHLFPPFICVDA